jgi:hypothetical protein
VPEGVVEDQDGVTDRGQGIRDKRVGRVSKRRIWVVTAVVLVMLVAVAASVYWATYPRHGEGHRRLAERSRVRSEIKSVELALEVYYADSGRYTTVLEELDYDPDSLADIRITEVNERGWRVEGTSVWYPNLLCVLDFLEPSEASLEVQCEWAEGG